MLQSCVFVCAQAPVGSCCADFRRNRWSCQGSAQAIVCEKTCECAYSLDVRVLLISSTAFPQIYCGGRPLTVANLHTAQTQTHKLLQCKRYPSGLAYLSVPLTLSSLILVKRLFTAKLMFANTQSCHTPYPFECVCVCVCPS